MIRTWLARLLRIREQEEKARIILVDREGVAYPPTKRVVLRAKP